MRRIGWVIGGVVLLLAAVAGLLAGLLATSAGARLVGASVGPISGGQWVVSGVSGRLIGPLEIAELRVQSGGVKARVLGLVIDWAPRELGSARLHLSALRAQVVEIETVPGGPTTGLPESLQWPLAVDVDDLRIKRMSVADSALPEPQVVTDVSAALHSDGRVHRLHALALESHWGAVRGAASLDGRKPFALRGEAAAGMRGQAIDLVATVSGTLSAFDAVVKAQGRELAGQARARVTPFDKVPLSRLEIAFDALNPAALIAGAPAADLSIRADWVPRGQGADITLVGPITIANRKPATIDADGIPVERLSAQVSLAAHAASLSKLQMQIHQGGQVSGSLDWREPRIAATLGLAQVNLRGIHSTLAATRLQGEVSASGAGAVWKAQGRVRDERVSAEFVAGLDREVLTVEQVALQAAGGRATGAGRMGLAGSRAFEFEGVLNGFDPAQFVAAPHAAINAQVHAAGSLAPGLAAKVKFELKDSTLDTPAGKRALAGQGAWAFADKRVSEVDVRLDLAGNRMLARGAFGAAGDVLEVDADMPALANLGLGLRGQIKGFARLRGTYAVPALALDLAGRDLRWGALSMSEVALRGGLADGPSGAVDLSARVVGVRVDEQLMVASGTLGLAGTRGANQIRLAAQLGDKLGGGSVVAQASGGLRDPTSWRGDLTSFQHQSARYPLALESPARLEIGAQQVVLGGASLAGKRMRVKLIDTRWSPGSIITRGEMAGLRVSAPQWVAGGVQVGARWDVSLAAIRAGTVSVFREAGDIAFGGEMPVSVGLGNARLDAELAGSRLSVKLAASGARLGDVAGQISAGLAPGAWVLAPNAPVAGTLRVSMPALDWLGPMLDPNFKTGGQVSGQVALRGTAREPVVEGEAQGKGLAIALIDQGLRLQDGVLSVSFSHTAARLEELSFVVPERKPPRGAAVELPSGDGRITARGVVDLLAPSMSIDVVAQRAALLSGEGQWLVASGEGKLVANRDGAKVEGRTRVDAAVINYQKQKLAALSDDVVVLGRDQPVGRRFRLDVDVLADLGEKFFFQAQGLNARLDGQVRVRGQGTAGLQASGSIRVADGVFDAYGQSLAIERGVVNFQGPLDNPGLNVRAIRRGLAVEAGVEVTGTAQAPKVRLVSDPSVPDAEKLSWIVLGRGLDQAGAGGGADSALLLSAASMILGGRDGKGIPQQLGRALGFDEVSVGAAGSDGQRAQTTVAGSVGAAREQGLPSAVVQVGKRLSQSAYLSYEHGLLGLESVVKLTYALSRRMSVVGRAGTDNAVDVFYTFSFD